MQTNRGFTLVEMIVAVALFGVVMLVSVTALLALIDANRKAQALQSVINNLNISVDGMSRAIREGSNYRCDSSSGGDCTSGDNGGVALYFTPFGGTDPAQDWVYRFDTTGDYCGINRLCKSERNGQSDSYSAITSDEVTIDSLTFYVFGSDPGDTDQPKVMMVIKGTAGAEKLNIRTSFHLQSTAVQRILDI